MYDKANSILEIRKDSNKIADVWRRVKPLFSRLDRLDVDDPLFMALSDLASDGNGGQGKFYLRDHVIEEIARLPDSSLERYLRYRYSYDMYPELKVTGKYPPLVQIEPTSICNYRCIFCYQIDDKLSNKKNGHMGIMTLDLFKNIVDQLVGNVDAISLASRGEPTVNKQLPEMLEYISGKFLAAKLNTNAFLLTEKLSHALLSADIQTLVFSADAAEEPFYSQMRINGKLDTVLRNIEMFNSIKEKHYSDSKMITRVSGVKYDRQKQDLDAMEAFWGHLVDQVMFVDYNPWEKVYDAAKKNISEPCSDLWRRMFIWWDGSVAPCDVDYLTTMSSESILEKTISEIWQGVTYSNLRRAHLNKQRQELEPCSRCVVL